MKKILSVVSTLALILSIAACGSAKETKPVYKFTAKANGTLWATDMVEPSTTPTEAMYVNWLYYSPASKAIYLEVKNPKNSNSMSLYIYLESYATAVGTYTRANNNFIPNYKIANSDALSDQTTTGSFEITKFSYDPNSDKITALSGKFSFKQTADHWDGAIRTYDVTEGEINNLANR